MSSEVVNISQEDQTRLFGQPGEITGQGVYSCTPEDHFAVLVKVLDTYFPEWKTWKIIDACACVGADTLHFARSCKEVLAIEKSPQEFTILQKNISTSSNITGVQGTCIDYLQEKSDMIYFDPPWGGPGYRERKEIPKCDEREVTDIAKEIIRQTPERVVILKVPDYIDMRIQGVNRFRINLFVPTADKKGIERILYTYLIYSQRVPEYAINVGVRPFDYRKYTTTK